MCKVGFSIVGLLCTLLVTGCDQGGIDVNESKREHDIEAEIASREWVKVPIDSLIVAGYVSQKSMSRKNAFGGVTSIAYISSPNDGVVASYIGKVIPVEASFLYSQDLGATADYYSYRSTVEVTGPCRSTKTLFSSDGYSPQYENGSYVYTGRCDQTITAYASTTGYYSGEGWVYESSGFDEVTINFTGPLISATITGPTDLDLYEEGTYIANVSSGSGNYSYEWQQKFDSGSYGGAVGTSQTFSLLPTSNSYDRVTLKVTVTDNQDGETNTDTHVVYINRNGGRGEFF